MRTTGRLCHEDFVPVWLRISVVSIVVLGIFFRLYHIDRKVFWEDEILGAVHSLGYTEKGIVAKSTSFAVASDVQRFIRPNPTLGVRQTVDSLAAEDPQHAPAYYVVSHFWTQRFGASVSEMRTPAAIFGVLVLPCVFWLALELFGSLSTALIAVALVAASPFFVLYAQEAREYSMWSAATAIQGAVFLRAIRLRSSALWIAYGLVTAASLYVYLLTGLVALGLTVYLLIRERGRFTRALGLCIIAEFGALVFFTPWLEAIRTSSGFMQGMSTILTSKLSPVDIVRVFARDLRQVFFDIGWSHLGPFGSSSLDAVFTVILLALCGYALFSLVRRTPFSVWGFVAIGLCASMMPLLLHDLFVRGNFVYQARYFLPLLLGIQLAVAALFGRTLLDRTSSATVRTASAALLSLVFTGELISCAISSQAVTWWNKDDERTPAVAAIINESHKPLVISDYFSPTILELSLYLDPAVPVRLNLKCAQCVLPSTNVTFDTSGYQSVFAVQAPKSEKDARYRWVDPFPFPAQPSPLNMFAVISPSGRD